MDRSADYVTRALARYLKQYAYWREIARSQPYPVDLDAMRDAARDAAQQRRAACPERSMRERRAGR